MAFNENGIVVPKYNDVKQSLETAFRSTIHENIDTTPDSLLGQTISILSDAISTAYEYIEFSHSQKQISSAIGRGLDEIGVLKGISRFQPRAANGYFKLKGKGNNSSNNVDVYIPSLSLISSEYSNKQFRLDTATRIKIDNCIEAQIEANPPVSLPRTYNITIEGVISSVVVNNSGDMTTEMNNLCGLIQVAHPNIVATYTPETRRILLYTSDFNFINVSAYTNFIEINVSTKAKFTATTKGSQSSVSGEPFRNLSNISTWIETTPISITMVEGLDLEGDTAYRQRIIDGGASTQRGTTPAVINALKNTAGVGFVTVEENPTPSIVNDIPAYGIHCIVQGGDNTEIAKVIWYTKGTVTPLKGSIIETFTDEFGISRDVKFSRPTAKPLDIRVTYTLYSEETPSVDLTTAIKNAVISHITALGLGVDVIPSRVYGSVYSTVDGIEITNVEVKTHGLGSFSNSRYPIANSEFASVIANDITVVVV